MKASEIKSSIKAEIDDLNKKIKEQEKIKASVRKAGESQHWDKYYSPGFNPYR